MNQLIVCVCFWISTQLPELDKVMRRSFASHSAASDHEQGDSSEASIPENLYLSTEQKQAMEEIWKNPKCSILTVLPVGGGKTALFNELAKLNRGGEVSIMISPYRALLANQMHRAKQEGLQSLHCSPGANFQSAAAVQFDRIWNAARGCQIPYAQAIYVTPEQLQRGTIFTLLLTALAEHNMIRMIFVDEVHELVSGVASFYQTRIDDDDDDDDGDDDDGDDDDGEKSKTGKASQNRQQPRPQQPWRRGGALAVQNFIQDIRRAAGNAGDVRVVLATATATESERQILVNEFLSHGRPNQYPAPISIISSSVFPAATLQFTTIFCRPQDSDHTTRTNHGHRAGGNHREWSYHQSQFPFDHQGTTTTTMTMAQSLRHGSFRQVEIIPHSDVDAALAIIVSHFSSSPQRSKGQILVCVRRRDLTIQLADDLRRRYGIYVEQHNRQAREERRNDGNLSIPLIGHWNSQLEDDEVGRVITEWESGKLQVVVATPGFGTGIHNPNTDLVIIVNPPLNATVLLQQLGRAGRSGNPGNAIVLIDDCRWKHQRPGRISGEQQQQEDEDSKRQREVVDLLYDQGTCIQQRFAKTFGDSSSATNSIAPCSETSAGYHCDRCDPTVQKLWRTRISQVSEKIQQNLRDWEERRMREQYEERRRMTRMREEEQEAQELEQEQILTGFAAETITLRQNDDHADTGGMIERDQENATMMVDTDETEPRSAETLIRKCWISELLLDGDETIWRDALNQFRVDLHQTILTMISNRYLPGVDAMISILRKSFHIESTVDQNQGLQRCRFCFALFNSNQQQQQQRRSSNMGIAAQHSTKDHRDCQIYAEMPANARLCFKCDFTSKIGELYFDFHHGGNFRNCAGENYRKGLLRTAIWWIWEYRRDWLRTVYTVLENKMYETENRQCILSENSRSPELDRQFYNWIYQPFNILPDCRPAYQPKVLHCILLIWYYCYGKEAMDKMG